VPRSAALFQNFGVNTFPIVPDANTKHLNTISNFGLNVMSMRVLIRVSQDLKCDAVNLVSNGWRQVSVFTLFNQYELRRLAFVISGMSQLLARCFQQFGKIPPCDWLRAQALNRITARRERSLGITDRLVERLHCLIWSPPHQIANRLKLEHQSVKVLKQGVMQFARDAGSLVHARFQPDRKLPLQLLHPKLI
jgi:hypothetical protein